MSTDRQIEANRINAAQSTGPTTDIGKSTSSKNATAHGLYSAVVAVHHWESKTEFDTLRHGFLTRFRPIDCVEADLVNRLVDTTWRRNRVVSMETTLLDIDISDMDEQIAQNFQESEDGLLRITHAFLKRHGDGVWDAIQRHLTAAERSYQRAMRELRLLQGDRFNMDVVVAETPHQEEAPEAQETKEIAQISERSQFRTQPIPFSLHQSTTRIESDLKETHEPQKFDRAA